MATTTHQTRPFTRRRLLVGAGALGAAGAVTAGTLTHPWTALAGSGATTVPAGRGTLVLVTLYGGNDGLNTVIPYTDSAYLAGRPTLGYQPHEVLPLGDGLALNPKLAGMKGLWDARHLAIVRGVGYPDPSLSHFQSMDIWQTANPEGSGTGWLGRWLDGTGTDPMRAISVGASLPLALRGERAAATAITGPSIALPKQPEIVDALQLMRRPAPDRTGLAGQVSAAMSDLLAVSADLDRLSPQASAPAGGARRGATSVGDQLGVVASLIKAGAPTRVYQVSQSSFDTHANEKQTQEELLSELDHGVSSFFSGLKGSPHGDGVVLMTYSEFGRRVAENASGGTDHGTANPLFVVGPGVRGGRFYGEQPSLRDLDSSGDLKHNVDFRSVYATMLEHVVGVDPRSFLGGTYPTLSLV